MAWAMAKSQSAQAAHDALLGLMPEGLEHACELCDSDGHHPQPQEVASVADEERTYTEAEHFALLTDAVSRETANATAEAASKITELESKVDVLEAEKAEAVTKAEKAEQDLIDFKAELELAAEIEGRKEARVAAVREISLTELPDTYFTDERVSRWAEMADEQFNSLLDDMAASAAVGLTAEEAKLIENLDGEALRAKFAEIAQVRRETAGDEDDESSVTKETAAFKGGTSPTNKQGSSLGAYFATRGLAPTTK